MDIALVGAVPTKQLRRALAAVGFTEVAPDRAAVRVFVGPKPPTRAPKAPWIWLATPSGRTAGSRKARGDVGRGGVARGDVARGDVGRGDVGRGEVGRGGRSPHAAAELDDAGELDALDASAAVLAGAYDALPLGPQLPQLLARRCAELAIGSGAIEAPPEYVAHSDAARRVLDDLDRAAHTAMAVLITGETGTGKDLAARYIHARSGRRGELVPINCAAIPNELIEGELFGYVRGAFSGAVADYDGLIQAAAGGTVFFDEVDDTPKTLQVKLLRVLEDHVIAKLGENAWREVDFRIVAATNRDLGELVQRGEFGADLYQRLAIVRIELPPLRERDEDLPELVAQLLARYYREDPAAPHRVVEITPQALAALRRYPWPGNVRELRNVIFHALVRKRGGSELLLSDLPHHVVRGGSAAATDSGALFDRAAIAKLIDNGRMNLRATRDQLERAALELALARSGGSPARAARLLGEVGRGRSRDPAGTVRAMMRRHGLG